eukprot:9572104-Lingulodinium_polyedra.AAC.1
MQPGTAKQGPEPPPTMRIAMRCPTRSLAELETVLDEAAIGEGKAGALDALGHLQHGPRFSS